MNRVKTVITTVSFIAFLALSAFSYNLYKDNITYKTYLSDILSSKASSLISTISNIDRTLEQVIDSQSISKSQASTLYGNFNNLKTQTEGLITMGNRLNKIPENQLLNVVKTNTKITEYFKDLYNVLELEETDSINAAQLKDFKEYKGLMDLYKDIAKTNVLGVTESGVNGQYWNEYFADGVDKKYWINLINRMEDVTPEYTDFALLQ